MLSIQRHVRVAVDRQGVIGRRDFLKGISLAALTTGTLHWTELVSASADELRRRGRACILLWMQGGPSQFETFDPKPQHENGGQTKSIATSIAGIEISENFPELAKVMAHVALVRSMTSKEGNHQRASFLLHTGYLPNPSVKYPTLGSLVAQQLPAAARQLPAFVRVGDGGKGVLGGAGFLGVDHDPFVLARAGGLPENAKPTTSADRYRRRLGLLTRLDADYAAHGGQPLVTDHQKLYEKTSRMILAEEMKTFDLSREPQSTRVAYGESEFGAGCLLARRLVETGVTFVEVQHRNWDTHQDNFSRVRDLAGQVDRPFAQLIRDLDARGLLDTTLIVWMGEFGRTPRINPRGGRDHYPRAFNVALAGGGIRGGQVIGKTDDAGTAVVDQPVGVQDLFQTFCKSLQIDPTSENMSPIGRPIKVVDGGKPLSALFG